MHHGVFLNNSRRQDCERGLRVDLKLRLDMCVYKLKAYLNELENSISSSEQKTNKCWGLRILLDSLSQEEYANAEAIALELLGKQTTEYIPDYLKPSIKYRKYIPWGKSRAETLADEAFAILNDINSERLVYP